MTAVGSAHIDRVVLGFDGSPSSRIALDVAVGEAHRRSVPLFVVTGIDDSPGYPLALTDRAESARQAALDGVRAATEALGEESVYSRVEFGPSAEVLLRRVRPSDLVVVGSHGHRAVGRMLLGSTSAAVLTHSAGPVLVVRGDPGEWHGPVLVGVDGSAHSLAALAFGAEMAAARTAPLRVVMAIPDLVDASGEVSGPDEPEIRTAESQLRQYVEAVLGAKAGTDAEALVVQGHPADVLVHHADQSQLVVLGSRGRGTFSSLLLGSVGREVSQRATCPGIVLRPGA
jgi:nucleotide-binding universal stress UspA family protein